MSAQGKERQNQENNPFEVRASSISLPALRLFTGDLDAIVESLEDKIRQAPEFFRDAPVVIDVSGLEEDVGLAELCGILRGRGMVPVGIRGGSAGLVESAKSVHLAVFRDVRHDHPVPSAPPAKAPVEAKPAVSKAAEAVVTKVVQQPVRSGQRIYAVGGDLIVLAPVSAGAEIMADGNIHVYGSLRGRALAGVQGNVASRIFCMDLQAELVSVAGHYKISENLDPSVRNKPVQIYLNQNSLIIEDL